MSFVLEGDCNVNSFKCQFGVYRSKHEFLSEAMRLAHPFDASLPLPDALKRALHSTLCNGPAWVVAWREQVLRQWSAWASELELEEVKLKASLEPGVAGVLKPKRVLLLKRIAESISWPDMAFFDELCAGFNLVGNQAPSGIFSTELRPAELTVAELKQRVQFMKPALLGKVRASECCEDALLLWDKTLKEVEEGCLQGPFSVEEIERRHSGSWLPTRRFGVWQSSAGKQKLRPIDDYSENKVNQAFGYSDKLDLRALDHLVAAIRFWVRSVKGRGTVEVALSDGTILSGKLHPDWRDCSERALELTALDLRSAYKQFAISPESRSLSILALKHPFTGDLACFETEALPFGSNASVVHFSRAARLLQAIGHHLMLCWTNYFDDYPTLSPRTLSASTHHTLRTLVALLGFDCSWDKLQDFGPLAALLGVEVDVSKAEEEGVLIGNKEGRASEAVAAIVELVETGSADGRAFLSVLGRIQFADAQVVGRAGRLALAEIRSLSKRRGSSIHVGQDLRAAFEVLAQRLSSGSPRVAPCELPERPPLVFTDGASEGEIHTVGGILIRPGGLPPRFFACHVPASLVESWRKSMKHLIGPVKTFAAVVARAVWHQFLSGQAYIHFIDNVGSQDSFIFIKGTSSSAIARSLLAAFEQIELNGAAWAWFARVPSDSNCADEPSRGCFDGILRDIKALRDVCYCPVTGVRLRDICSAVPEGRAWCNGKVGVSGTTFRPSRKGTRQLTEHEGFAVASKRLHVGLPVHGFLVSA